MRTIQWSQAMSSCRLKHFSLWSTVVWQVLFHCYARPWRLCFTLNFLPASGLGGELLSHLNIFLWAYVYSRNLLSGSLRESFEVCCPVLYRISFQFLYFIILIFYRAQDTKPLLSNSTMSSPRTPLCYKCFYDLSYITSKNTSNAFHYSQKVRLTYSIEQNVLVYCISLP
jgi:hypothetical protein